MALLQSTADLCAEAPEQAAEMYIEAQQYAEKEDPAPYSGYAYALYCMGEYEACVQYIEDDLALGKEYSVEVQNDLSEILGASYFALEDYAAAASFFRLSTAGGDISVSAMRDYAVALGRLGDPDAAEEVLIRMEEDGAQSAELEYVKAEVKLSQKDYAAAETGFLSIMEQEAGTTLGKQAFLSLVNVYQECAVLERLDQSPIPQAAMKEAQLIETGMVTYGLSYDSTLWEQAALAYFEAANMNENDREAYLNKSLGYFRNVLDMNVKKEYLYANLYTIHYQLEQYEEAMEILQKYETGFPDSYVPHALRGMLLIQMENGKENRDYSEAEVQYQTAEMKLRGTDDKTYYQQLQALMEQLEQDGWLNRQQKN